MKNMLSVITFTVASLGFSITTYADSLGVQRTILQIKDATVVQPAVSPPVFDKDHAKMQLIQSPKGGEYLYTSVDAQNLDDEAKAYLLSLTGYDISQAIPHPTLYGPFGVKILNSPANAPIALVANISVGNDDLYKVLYDSKKDEKNNGKWTIRNNSVLIQFITAGTFPGGTLAGQSYQAGTTVSYGYTDHLKLNSNWTSNDNRDRFRVYTSMPGLSVKNSMLKDEVHIPLKYEELKQNGEIKKVGFGSDNTYVQVSGPSGSQATRSTTHHLITFFDQDNQ